AILREEPLEEVIRAVGTMDYDERKVRRVHLRTSGWITRLHGDYTGRFVRRGDPLLTLYSPDLVTTQEEYLLARGTRDRVEAAPVSHVRNGAETLAASARDRLLFYDLTDSQIAELERRGSPEREMTLFSPIDGFITKKTALQGMYVTPETELYEIADLSTVWVYADVYEYEIPRVRTGQEAAVTLTAYPGETFHGRVTYVSPTLDPETRTVRVRTEFPNPGGRLKPGMYGDVEIRMALQKGLAVPQEAVLDSGARKIVFVDQGDGMYAPREVRLGGKVDHFYPVLSGLTPGERVVTSATFLIDSESRLAAAANMMGMVGMGGIRMEQARMGEMEMAGMEMKDMKGMEGMPMTPGAKTPPSGREQTVDGFTVSLRTEPDPLQKGENKILVTVRSKEGPVTDGKVTVAYTMAMPGMEVETVEAVHVSGGTYAASADFAMKGAWKVDVTVVPRGAQKVKAGFTVKVGK
ncbi:MAG: efflux RND transporter periplasmic adaptor subunit, partial [Nitrospirae bacterium]|nr:efflux RND transporter periplasmic adaptor subunit [Nitrospirota bacterium]